MSLREDRYLYETPGDIVRLSFEGRNFVVVRASAYDAGIVGSEYNGIAILDRDNGAKIADRVGNYDPTTQATILALFKDPKLNWKRFCDTIGDIRVMHGKCFDHIPRDVLQGQAGGQPDRVDPVLSRIRGTDAQLPDGPDIRTKEQLEANASDKVPYHFGARTREEMIVAICTHRFYADHGGPAQLAWNIKVRDFDDTGHNGGGDTEGELDPNLDAFWDAMKPRNLFDRVCRQELRQYLDGEASTYPGDDQGDWKFSTAGRSGGWLLLEKWRGRDVTHRSLQDFVEELREMDDAGLAAFYGGLVTLDADLANPSAIVGYGVSVVRSDKEDAWKEAPQEAIGKALSRIASGDSEMTLDIAADAATKALGLTPVEFLALAIQDEMEVDDVIPAAARLGVPLHEVVALADEEGYVIPDELARTYAPVSADAPSAPTP